MLDGLITFYSAFHAVRGEALLVRCGMRVRLVPTPREISSSCGVALQLACDDIPRALEVLAAGRVEVEATHHYAGAARTSALLDRLRRRVAG
jgi:hypothetical protein